MKKLLILTPFLSTTADAKNNLYDLSLKELLNVKVSDIATGTSREIYKWRIWKFKWDKRSRWRLSSKHHFSIITKYVDEMARERENKKDRLKPQLFTTFSYNWNGILKGLDGRVIIKNLFDKKHVYRANRSIAASSTIAEPDDLPRRRFNLYGEITYKF